MNNLRKYLSWQFYKMYKRLKPKDVLFTPDTDDIFLVSYPRSGNTWMRVILTELIYGKIIDSLAEVEKYIPDLHFKPKNKDVIQSDYHIIKSHDPNNYRFSTFNYKKIIYLIRDPRDVVLSHFRYSVGRGNNRSFDDFLVDWVNGRIWPTSWQEHVNSWVGNSTTENDFKMLIIRYEDLKINTFEIISKVNNFSGLQKSNDDILSSISNASLDKMKTKEEKGLRKGEDNETMQFIGKGKSGNWKNSLSPAQIDLIYEYAKIPMKKFNYK